MEEQKNMNAATVINLELLNKQVAEILKMQRKVVSGYDYLNAIELSELLGESIKTIYNRVHKRQIPFYKPGRKLLLFKYEEIQEWIKSSRHATIEELQDRI